MIEQTTEIGEPTRSPRRSGKGRAERLALVVAWSAAEPGRLGEVGLVPWDAEEGLVLGRGAGSGERRVELVRQRPGENVPTGPLAAPRLSRKQLRVQALQAGRLSVERLGRAALRVRGQTVDQAIVEPGERIEIEGQLLLHLTRRPGLLPPAHYWEVDARRSCGTPDRCGLVGESAAMWKLRDLVAFVASHAGHVLVLGPSGAGKELVARAIHHLSARARRRLIARNAATIPEGLIDAELFGNARHYPNQGMSERPGLVGEADGSTLFLDEIGELPEALQAHLLRLMDDGEYQRLGEARARRADLRLIGATNRPRETLKADLGARFRHAVPVPPLDDRREDLPLLLGHLLRVACTEDPRLGRRFLDEAGNPRVDVRLVDAVLGHPLTLQVRELDALLWQCLAESTGDRVELSPALATRAAAAPSLEPARDPTSLTAEEIRACLDEHDWVQERVWRELGLGSRYVLRRLMRKHGLTSAEG